MPWADQGVYHVSPKEEKRGGQVTEPGKAGRGGQGRVVSSSEYLASFYII